MSKMNRRDINLDKIREERQAIGETYQKYIETFQETTPSILKRKTFIKSAILYNDKENICKDKEKMESYQPVIKLRKLDAESSKSSESSICNKNKTKSNLRSLGDELKMLQTERKSLMMKDQLKIQNDDSIDTTYSTNLYVSNLKPTINEDDLIKIFGIYGPLASVKLMWPRKEQNQPRIATCGFVAYMNRSDAEKALKQIKNHSEIKIDWAKAVEIPSFPIFIPDDLYVKLYKPPPPSGLPFNAQITDNNNIKDAVIKIRVPFNRNHLFLIHRTIEFVINYGPQFEALIMTKEQNNIDYAFMFDYKSAEHTYYRWKLFSILNGDLKDSWSLKPFRMYENGSIWVPPTPINYIDGSLSTKKSPPENCVKELIQLIRNLTMKRNDIAKAMKFCLDRKEYFEDYLKILFDSFKSISTNPLKKIARLYLLSDMIHNYKMKHTDLLSTKYQNYSKQFIEIFHDLHQTYKNCKHRNDSYCFELRISKVLNSWLIFQYFNINFVRKLKEILLYGNDNHQIDTDGDDLNLLNDEPLDGANLLKRSTLISSNDDCLIVNKFDMFL